MLELLRYNKINPLERDAFGGWNMALKSSTDAGRSTLRTRFPTRAARLLVCAAPASLCACKPLVLLHPSGDVASQQGHLILVSTALMLLIIVPVIVATLYFAWHYRQSNTRAKYAPQWHHSIQLELVIWSAPLLIVIALGAIAWISTHTLDPYRPLQRIDPQHAIDPQMRPLTVQVVALDWKWLFIYPEQGIATVNEMAAPVDTPIEFHITAESVMNSFDVPALAGQIYAMPGMETRLHAVINTAGDYEGFSSNYSGAGFSAMRFRFRGMAPGQFEQWVRSAREPGLTLDRDAYAALQRPSARDPVRRYASVAEDLFDAIVRRCVAPGDSCAPSMPAMPHHERRVPQGMHIITLAPTPHPQDRSPNE